ncbi:MAG: competence/damage-inducible protein A [Clostridiales Family XIII bacterium]|jgi:nicotinamide-nucleotide amidase|nr:competence/damage-inducible protein A [Clostridiales Family XIII bacterium]
MITATILSIGTELLFGQTVNTNAAEVSLELQALGIGVLYHHTVGDNPGRMREVLELSLKESDIVITTGGLGPTQDDITKELIAEVMGVGTEFNEEALTRMTEMFQRLGRKNFTENNKKQAYLPVGSTVFQNDEGTAPGFALRGSTGSDFRGKVAIALPGPPREMRAMLKKDVIPYLAGLSDAALYQKNLRFYGVGESALETLLLPLIDGQTDPTIATYAKDGECIVRIASMRGTEAEAEAAVLEAVLKVKAIAGKYLYSSEGEELSEVVVRKLREKGLVLAAAESCTGGLFAKNVTDISGASAVFDRGFVTYSNEAKTELLGVPEAVIEEFGAVSRETAELMSEGALQNSAADIAIAVTGIAGPEGGTEEKPVGLCYISVSRNDEASKTILTESIKKTIIQRSRSYIRSIAVLEMFNQLLIAISEK